MSSKFMRIELGGPKQLSKFIMKGGVTMFYVGIDIAKSKHYASVMSSDGEILVEAFPFQNDIVGFQKLISKISNLDKKHLVFGLESTAHYGENLIEFLYNLQYNVAVINPIQTATLRKSNIRKTKNDKVDTYLIIKSLIVNNYRLITSRDINIIKLKGLCSSRQNLVTLRTRSKIQLATYVDQLFPELNSFFKAGLHINASYQLLKNYTTPNEIANLHLTTLSNLLKNASRGKYSKPQAIKLKELAKTSIGIKSNPILSIQIKHAISQIELFNSQIDEVENTISSIMNDLNSKIMTIPGIGYINGAMILACIGDFKRFSHPSKILAFAGLDPNVIQSGNFSARTTRMSKRGSGMLRYSLINASHNVVKNNKTFKQYYDLKVSQGKSHYNALGHVSYKLIRVIYTLLTKNVEFDLQ